MDRGVPRDADRPDVHSLGSGDAHGFIWRFVELNIDLHFLLDGLCCYSFTYIYLLKLPTNVWLAAKSTMYEKFQFFDIFKTLFKDLKYNLIV